MFRKPENFSAAANESETRQTSPWPKLRSLQVRSCLSVLPSLPLARKLCFEIGRPELSERTRLSTGVARTLLAGRR